MYRFWRSQPKHIWKGDRPENTEITAFEKGYVAALGLVSCIPSALATNTMLKAGFPPKEALRVLFTAPVQYFVSLMIGTLLVMASQHLAQKEKLSNLSFRIALSAMSFYPLYCFLHFYQWGEAAIVLLYGLTLGIAVRRRLKLSNTVVIYFFGAAYIAFAVFQLKSSYSTPPSLTPPSLPAQF